MALIEDVTPCIVLVTGYDSAAFVCNRNHIALQVCQIVIDRVADFHGNRPVTVIYEIADDDASCHLNQLAAIIHICVSGTAVGLACPHPVGIVGVAPCGGTVGHGSQLSAVLPCVGPCAIRLGITNTVIGNGAPIIGGQQVAPRVVGIAIGNCIQRCALYRGPKADT